jgi:hypothetical protein
METPGTNVDESYSDEHVLEILSGRWRHCAGGIRLSLGSSFTYRQGRFRAEYHVLLEPSNIDFTVTECLSYFETNLWSSIRSSIRSD